MPSKPALVSILMPFKNTGAYLVECLQSISDQTYTNWEVLAVDDHSEDDSRQLLETHALTDPRFRLLTNMGAGIIPALRTAYLHSQGLLITRMDSDDIMPPDKLNRLVQPLMQSGPGHVATGRVRYFSIRGISDGYQRYERWLNRLTSAGDNFSEIYKECPIPSPCWMVWRTDLDACGAFESDRYPEDYDLCFRFYEKGLLVIPSTDLLHYWRDYDQRTSRTSEQYAQNYFLDIKLHYFLRLDHDPGRPLVLWGAGSKGKALAATLAVRKIPFTWLCDNPKKIGKAIYGVTLRHFSALDGLRSPQSIISVANEKSQAVIAEFFAERGQQAMKDYFFFC